MLPRVPSAGTDTTYVGQPAHLWPRVALITIGILLLGAMSLAYYLFGQRGAGVTRHETLTVHGQTRTYLVYRPPSLPANQPVPAVIVLHGHGASGAVMERITGFDRLADSDKFIVVYPDGVGHSWNAGACCDPAESAGIDDVGFLVSMLQQVEAAYSIDPRRVYVAGFSNGGLFAYTFACQQAHLIAAIGVVEATMVGACHPSNPVSVMHIHGIRDTEVPFAGGTVSYAFEGNTPLLLPPVSTVLQQWRTIDGCAATSTKTRVDTTTVTAWTACSAGTAVQLDLLDGGVHLWPGGHSIPELIDPVERRLDASQAIWQFFAAHPRSA
jgi:polyhydroxybutyrate depolymerase